MSNEQLIRIQASIARSEALFASLKETKARLNECNTMGDDVATDYREISAMIVQITAVIEQLHVMKNKAIAGNN